MAYSCHFTPYNYTLFEKDAYITNDLKEMLSRLDYLNEARGIGLFAASPGSGKTFALRCFAKGVNLICLKV